MGEDEVLIKIAADISAAVGAMTTLIDQLKDMVEAIKGVGAQTEQSEEQTKGFWETWLSGIDKGGAASVAWGNQMADAFKQIEQGVKDAITGFPSMVASMAAVGDETGTLANRLDLTAESVAELQYISGQSGANMQQLARTIQGFGVELQDTTSKSSQAVEALGLSVEDLQKMGKDQAFFTVLQEIQKLPEGVDKTAQAMEIFGSKFRGSTMLLKEDIGGLRDRFKELGGPDGVGALAKSGDAYSDALADIQVSQDAFKRSLANAVLPAVNEMLQKMPMLGGAVLTVGESLMDVASSFGPMITNLLILNSQKGFAGLFTSLKSGATTVGTFVTSAGGLGGALTKIGPAITGVVAGMGGFSGILAAITGPIGLTVVAVTALAAILYKAMGGWEGIKAAMGPVIQFFEDLYVVGEKVVEIVFKELVEMLGEAIAFLGDLYVVVKQVVVEGFMALVKWIQDTVEYARSLPIIGTIINAWITAFKDLVAVVLKAWEAIKKVGTAIGDFAKKAATFVGGWADSIRAAEAATEQAVETNKEFAASTKPVVSGLDRMLLKAKEVEKTYKSLTAAQKSQIKTLIEAGNSTKDIAEVMAKGLGVSVDIATKAIDKYKEALQKAKKEGDKTPFQKLAEEVKVLGKAMVDAEHAGLPAAAMLEQFGKKAADAVEKARGMPGALEKIPPNVREIAQAFTEAEIAPKLKDITDKALELAQAFGAQLADGARAAASATKNMVDEMRLNLMTDADAKIERIRLEEEATVESLQRQQGQLNISLAAQITAIRANTAERIKIEQQRVGAGNKISDETMERIREEERLAIQSAETKSQATQKSLSQQLTTTRAFYTQKMAIEQKDTKNFELDMKLRGITTKAVAAEQLRIERDKLAQLEALNDPFYDKQIRAQKEVVDQAEIAAGKIVIDWGGALESITRSFEQLATIAGGTFGGLMKGIGEVAGGLSVMKASFDGVKKMFGEAGGLKGIGESFKGAFGGSGALGAVKGLMSGLGTVLPMVGGIISGVTAAISVGKKLWDGLTKSGGEKVAEEVGKKFGVKITEAMGDAINKTAKEHFKGDRFAAEIFHIGDIIKEAGGLTEKNFGKMMGNLNQMFGLVAKGKMSAEQARETLDKNFGAFANHILQSGKVANKQFQELLRMNQQSGVQSQEVIGFVTAQTSRLGSALSKLAAGQTQSNESMARFERLAVAGFNAALAAGVPFLDALDQMGPALDKIIEGNKKLGREGGAAIQELLRFREVAAANRDLVDSASSLNEVMLALSNVGALNTETMADLQAQGAETFAKLTEAGFTETQSLQQMKGFLEQVRNAHRDLGLPIDENTQKLIAQAEQQGVLKAEQMSTNDIMLQGLGAIIEALGGKMPEAFKAAADAGVKAGAQIKASTDGATKAVVDQSSAVTGVPWVLYATKGSAAGNIVGKAMGGVTDAVGGVQGQLEGTDWDGWSDAAVHAANEAQAAIDAVSLGSSPGGIKEIPLKLKDAMRSFRDWERVGVKSAEAVSEAVNSMGSGSAPDAPDHMAGIASAVGALASQDMRSTIHLEFSVTAINADGVKQAVERDILPVIIDAVDRNNRGALTKLRQLMNATSS